MLAEIVEYGLQPFFKFAAKFGPCNQRPHVQRQQTLAFESLRDLSIDNALCQAFYDGRLPYARLTNQNGVVLDILVQPKRDRFAAIRFFRKLLRSTGRRPHVIVTDKLRSYAAAKRMVMPGVLMSSRANVKPRCLGAVWSVRTIRMHHSA